MHRTVFAALAALMLSAAPAAAQPRPGDTIGSIPCSLGFPCYGIRPVREVRQWTFQGCDAGFACISGSFWLGYISPFEDVWEAFYVVGATVTYATPGRNEYISPSDVNLASFMSEARLDPIFLGF